MISSNKLVFMFYSRSFFFQEFMLVGESVFPVVDVAVCVLCRKWKKFRFKACIPFIITVS